MQTPHPGSCVSLEQAPRQATQVALGVRAWESLRPSVVSNLRHSQDHCPALGPRGEEMPGPESLSACWVKLPGHQSQPQPCSQVPLVSVPPATRVTAGRLGRRGKWPRLGINMSRISIKRERSRGQPTSARRGALQHGALWGSGSEGRSEMGRGEGHALETSPNCSAET